ncbi:protein SPIRAL1-like 1 [Benincasa hispida]|uniref:protein SPIRAL1-like 1 n=1 Tax=Benincasa hispida TaxID=102211 RepID=UPI0018FF508F|nr:protein SPIRAL1-like 1 [Benincasa hispida]
MSRGVSSGGGQSSLGYLFGNGEPANDVQPSQKSYGSSQLVASTSPLTDKQTPAGIPGHLTNNYYRADGQNCGNFITDRPSTKVHAAPGGGSSLDFLFGNGRS